MADNDKNVGKQAEKNVDFNYNLLSKEVRLHRKENGFIIPW